MQHTNTPTMDNNGFIYHVVKSDGTYGTSTSILEARRLANCHGTDDHFLYTMKHNDWHPNPENGNPVYVTSNCPVFEVEQYRGGRFIQSWLD